MRKLTIIVATLLVGVTFIGRSTAQDDDSPKPKYSIKEVMDGAHKKGLLKKVVAGDATKAEKDQLLDFYISLLENEPPVGERQSWIMMSGRAVVAAAAVAVGREGAEQRLGAATKCTDCHNVHKPKDN